MHRFKNDNEIRQFIKTNDYNGFGIDAQGAVYGYRYECNEGCYQSSNQIGWIV